MRKTFINVFVLWSKYKFLSYQALIINFNGHTKSVTVLVHPNDPIIDIANWNINKWKKFGIH